MNKSLIFEIKNNLTFDLRFYTDANGWSVVKEGEAEILFPTAKDVFYNPVQEFNRLDSLN